MKTYIALFRGINVGGNNALPMKELVSILESLGSQNVKTYIQSGNAVFQSQENDVQQLTSQIGAEIKQRCGFEPGILLIEPEDLEKALVSNPFPEGEAEPQTLHLGFLIAKPENPDLQTLERLKTASERFLLKDRVFYLHAPEGIGRSKLAASAERHLGVSMTDRNWRTVCKLSDMVKGFDTDGG